MLDTLHSKAKQLKREVGALYFAYQDSRTPWYARAFLVLVISMALSPIDLIPDFIPILGYLDDLILAPLGIALAIKIIPTEVMQDAHVRVESEGVDPKFGRVYTILVIIVWLLAAIFMTRFALEMLAE